MVFLGIHRYILNTFASNLPVSRNLKYRNSYFPYVLYFICASIGVVVQASTIHKYIHQRCI